MGRLIPDGDAQRVRRAVNDLVGKRQTVRIVQILRNVLFQHVGPDGLEVVADVRFQYPAVSRKAVFAVVFTHEVAQPIQPEVRAFAHLAAVVVQDEGLGQRVIQDLITEGVLDDFVLEAVRLDQAALRLVDVERAIAARPVGPGLQFPLDQRDGLQRRRFHLGDAVLPPLAAACFQIRVVQVSPFTYSFVVFAHSGEAPLAAQRRAAAWCQASVLCVYPPSVG